MTDAELAVLSLVVECPRHAYEVERSADGQAEASFGHIARSPLLGAASLERFVNVGLFALGE